MTEKMHPDDIGEGLEQTAKQLRAGMVPLMGASALADLLDQAREYMDCPEPSVQPPTSEQIAEAIYDTEGHPRVEWSALPQSTKDAYLGYADAVLALFPQPTEESGVCYCGTALESHAIEEHNYVDMGFPPAPPEATS